MKTSAKHFGLAVVS